MLLLNCFLNRYNFYLQKKEITITRVEKNYYIINICYNFLYYKYFRILCNIKQLMISASYREHPEYINIHIFAMKQKVLVSLA